MKKWEIFFLAGVLLVGLLFRVYRLAEVPAGLYIDELDLGYQAQSLLETGKDYRGTQSPFYVRSFNSDRTPVPAYAMAMTSLLFEKPELQVRMMSVFFGLMVIGSGYWLVRIWTQKPGAAASVAVILAVSPWQIQFSRIGFEATSVGGVYLLAMVLFFLWYRNRNPWYFLAASTVLGLGMYTYRTMSLFVPLTFVVWLVMFYKEIFSQSRVVVMMGALIAIMMTGSFLWATTVGAKDEARINQISIFSDSTVPIWVMRNREVDSGDLVDATVGKQAVWWSKMFHNKGESWAMKLANNYLSTFSSEFLFIKGDINFRHHVGKMGMLFKFDVIGLAAGLWWVVGQRKNKMFQWLLVWWLLAPLPAALTMDGNSHASRLYIWSLPLLLIVGLGWWRVMVLLAKVKWGWWLQLGIVVAYGISFGTYAHQYLTHYAIESARDFGYGYKQVIEKVEALKGNYRHVWISESHDPPGPYYWYWSRLDPRFVQRCGTDFSAEKLTGECEVGVSAINWKKLRETTEAWPELLVKGDLYVLIWGDVPLDLRPGHDVLPEGLRLVDYVTFPDNEPGFYLIERVDDVVSKI